MNQAMPPAPTRGLIVIGVAVIVGFLLLQVGFDDSNPELDLSAADDSSDPATDTTQPQVTASTAPEGGDPAAVPVYVGNGSGISGAAATVTETLKGLGYTAAIEPPGNATSTDISQVFFKPGADADAQAVATALGLPADRVVALADPAIFDPAAPETATVLVQVGTDFPGLAPA
jgi:hypothetical protein